MVGVYSRNLLMGTKAETMEEHCLLACQLWLRLLSYTIQTQRWHCLQGAEPAHINHKSRKCPTDMPTDKLMEKIPQLKFPLFT